MYRGPCDSLHVSLDSRMEEKRSRTGREISCPTIGALLRYRTRIVRVIAEARGQRAMIESLDPAGRIL